MTSADVKKAKKVAAEIWLACGVVGSNPEYEDIIAFAISEARREERERIANWLEALSRHRACTSEHRFWYEGVASDIRTESIYP